MQWRPFPAVLTAVLAILAGTFFQIKHDGQLKAAQIETKAARHQAALAISVVVLALDYADAQTVKADSAEAHAARSAATAKALRARAPLPVLPDTCAPAVVALARADSATDAALDAYASEHQAGQELRAALDTVTAASRPLVSATEHLSDAAGKLVKASKPSLFARLKPDLLVSGGVTRGVDLKTGDPRTVAGIQVGFGWRISL